MHGVYGRSPEALRRSARLLTSATRPDSRHKKRESPTRAAHIDVNLRVLLVGSARNPILTVWVREIGPGIEIGASVKEDPISIYSVRRRGDGSAWTLSRGSSVAVAYSTQQQAVNAAQSLARASRRRVVWYRVNGSAMGRASYTGRWRRTTSRRKEWSARLTGAALLAHQFRNSLRGGATVSRDSVRNAFYGAAPRPLERRRLP